MAWSYRNDAVFWHKQENNPDEALKHAAEYADQALQLAPDDANAHYARARIHTEAGEVEQAIARYDQAIAAPRMSSPAVHPRCSLSAESTKLSIGSSRRWASILSTLIGTTGTWAGRSGKRTIARPR
ncbi:tetratricopeptide repeat protein [Mesorhizobium sp. BHbsci]